MIRIVVLELGGFITVNEEEPRRLSSSLPGVSGFGLQPCAVAQQALSRQPLFSCLFAFALLSRPVFVVRKRKTPVGSLPPWKP